MKSKKNSKGTRRKGIENNYIKITKFGLQKKKKKKKKKKKEEKIRKRRRSCSLDFGPENVHQRK
jgi:hypothetical protein